MKINIDELLQEYKKLKKFLDSLDNQKNSIEMDSIYLDKLKRIEEIEDIANDNNNQELKRLINDLYE